jgi:hypothetical protein
MVRETNEFPLSMIFMTPPSLPKPDGFGRPTLFPVPGARQCSLRHRQIVISLNPVSRNDAVGFDAWR